MKQHPYRHQDFLIFCRFSTASATFLPNFSKNSLGKATGLDQFSAPAALTILLLCVSLILVTFALDETNCSPIGELVSLSLILKDVAVVK